MGASAGGDVHVPLGGLLATVAEEVHRQPTVGQGPVLVGRAAAVLRDDLVGRHRRLAVVHPGPQGGVVRLGVDLGEVLPAVVARRDVGRPHDLVVLVDPDGRRHVDDAVALRQHALAVDHDGVASGWPRPPTGARRRCPRRGRRRGSGCSARPARPGAPATRRARSGTRTTTTRRRPCASDRRSRSASPRRRRAWAARRPGRDAAAGRDVRGGRRPVRRTRRCPRPRRRRWRAPPARPAPPGRRAHRRPAIRRIPNRDAHVAPAQPRSLQLPPRRHAADRSTEISSRSRSGTRAHEPRRP